MFGPVKSASLLCQILPSQNPQNKTPSTAGWLKNKVMTFSRFAAFRLKSWSYRVNSVIHSFNPASATLSNLYWRQIDHGLASYLNSSLLEFRRTTVQNSSQIKGTYLKNALVFVMVYNTFKYMKTCLKHSRWEERGFSATTKKKKK